MRPLTSLTAKREQPTRPDAPKPAPLPPVATCQRDLVVWSLLVCPGPGKGRA